MNSSFLLGCDWGSSSFRLRLFNIPDQKVEGEINTKEGVVNTFKMWQLHSKKEGNPISREQFFRQKLKNNVELLSKQLSKDLNSFPIMISGMASSSLGMLNVDYSNLPYSLDGSNAVTLTIPADNDFKNNIVLISGVKSVDDVMRGEETQVLGMISLLKQDNLCPEKVILIFPGTHSKHIYIHGDKMTDFKTFMTGELYDLLIHHSILSNSVSTSKLGLVSEDDFNMFRKGIAASADSSILHNIFSVRTNDLLEVFDKHQNSIYLSGLLIGAELRCLLNEEKLPIILCSSSNLHKFYKLGLDELGFMSRTTILSNEMTDKATILGQSLLRNVTFKNTK
jgi:2-dehydro-3-deoxygalactonokinase